MNTSFCSNSSFVTAFVIHALKLFISLFAAISPFAKCGEKHRHKKQCECWFITAVALFAGVGLFSFSFVFLKH